MKAVFFIFIVFVCISCGESPSKYYDLTEDQVDTSEEVSVECPSRFQCDGEDLFICVDGIWKIWSECSKMDSFCSYQNGTHYCEKNKADSDMVADSGQDVSSDDVVLDDSDIVHDSDTAIEDGTSVEEDTDSNTGPEDDVDTGIDSDSESETPSDVNGDTEGESDMDSELDTVTDTADDAESDTDSEIDIVVDSDTESDVDTEDETDTDNITDTETEIDVVPDVCPSVFVESDWEYQPEIAQGTCAYPIDIAEDCQGFCEKKVGGEFYSSLETFACQICRCSI